MSLFHRSFGLLSVTGLFWLAGCATPGPVRPPSLNLPRPVHDLRAERRGTAVHLEWTSPERTTDNLLLPGAPTPSYVKHATVSKAGPQTAEICRAEVVPGASNSCVPIAHVTVYAGREQQFDDPLPLPLQTGSPRPLQYRVRTLNAAGRSAAASAPATAPAGDVPAPVMQLHVRAVREGVELSWQKSATALAGDTVLIQRTLINRPSAKPPKNTLAEMQIAASPDPGGAVDSTATRGASYRYMAVRVRRGNIGGVSYIAQGGTEETLSGIVRDTFPPVTPTGLVAVVTPANGANKAAIDLSWEASPDADLAGYVLYRREAGAGAMQRISASPVAGASYHDETALSGHTYIYQVSAVDRTGNESAKSNPATETMP